MSLALPMAHVGHYLWVLYLVPVLVVVGSIVKTTISERRKGDEDRASGEAAAGAGKGGQGCSDPTDGSGREAEQPSLENLGEAGAEGG